MTSDVAVVMPAWNASNFIEEAIRSALDQSTPPHTIVVVDDGSTDATAEIAASVDSRVTVLRREHEGIGRARTAGIAATTSELVAFLDADDVWLPRKLERQLAALHADDSIEAVFCRVDEFYDDLAGPLVGVRAPKVGVASALASAALVRREVFDRVGSFATTDVGEWVGWWARARALGINEHVVPEVLLPAPDPWKEQLDASRRGGSHFPGDRARSHQSEEGRHLDMSASPLVSVIVPVYERGYCVMDAVHSILDQTHSDLECIVVDDGSTDDSYERVAAASADEPRIRAFSQPHAGVSAARNFGLREARGTYVTFLDSDDLMVADRIRRQLEILAEQSCDAVIGRCEVFAVAGASLPSWLTPNEYYMTSMLLELRHVRRVGGFDETLVVGEDVDLLVRLRGAGLRLNTADETFTVRRYFGDNLTYTIDESMSALRDSIRRHIARRRAAVTE